MPATSIPVPSALASYVDALPRDGSFSIWAGPVTGDPTLSHRVDEQHYAASTMKTALVLAAFREAESGLTDLDAAVPVYDTFTSRADGSTFAMDRDEDSDPEPWRRLGSRVALRWLCHRALVRSSNLATNLVLEAVGFDAVAAALHAVEASHSSVSRGIEDKAAREAGLQNLVTACDLARTLQSLHAGTAASSASCREILSVLAAQQINDAIPMGLPPGTRLAHKSGWVDGISHDAGIVYPSRQQGGEPFVLAVCTTSELDEQAGLDLIAAGAAAAWADRRLLS